MIRGNFGQLSIEYILLAAILLGCIAVVFSSASVLFNAGLFAADAKNAMLFSGELEKNISFLGILSSGSSATIPASPLSEWKIFSSNGKISVLVESESLGENKTFSFSPALLPRLEVSSIRAGGKISVERAGEFVLIKNG